jgi:hypothetical protein
MTTHAPSRPDQQLSRSLFAIAFAAAFIFLYLRTVLLPATPFVVINDQVLFFARAARSAHGQVLYRDFFEIVTPGTNFLYATAFRIFGIHAWLIPAWTIAVGLTLCSVITLIASRIFRGPLLLLPAALFLVLDFSTGPNLTHHWYSTLFALAAVAVLAEDISLPRIAAAGSFCALAVLFTQTKGVLVFFALVAYVLWLKRFRTQTSNLLAQLTALILPFAAIVSSVLGYYIHQAGFRAVFFDLVTFPPTYMSGDDGNSPRIYLRQLHTMLSHHGLSSLLPLIPYLFIYALVPYIYFFGLYRLWSKRTTLSPALRQLLVLLHLVGLALFLAIADGPTYFRLGVAAPPAILILIWLISQQSPTQQLLRRAFCILALFFAVALPAYRQIRWHATLDLPFGKTAFYDNLLFQQFQWTAQRTHPSEPFFNEPALGLYLALDNPTQAEFVTYAEFTRPEQLTAILHSLQQHPPRFIFMNSTSSAPNPHDHTAPFRQYLHDNYHLARVFPLEHGEVSEECWERNPATSQTQ